jgi:hypothetical protein
VEPPVGHGGVNSNFVAGWETGDRIEAEVPFRRVRLRGCTCARLQPMKRLVYRDPDSYQD